MCSPRTVPCGTRARWGPPTRQRWLVDRSPEAAKRHCMTLTSLERSGTAGRHHARPPPRRRLSADRFAAADGHATLLPLSHMQASHFVPTAMNGARRPWGLAVAALPLLLLALLPAPAAAVVFDGSDFEGLQPPLSTSPPPVPGCTTSWCVPLPSCIRVPLATPSKPWNCLCHRSAPSA